MRGEAKPVKLPAMMFRSVIRVAEWLGAILGSLALVVGGCFWLLSRGPLSLDWLAPYVATSFADAEPGLRAHIDHTYISLGEGPSLEITARGLHLSRADGRAELTLPVVALWLSPEAALRGRIAPTSIELRAPHLRLLRTADGSFHLGLAGEQPGKSDWAESLLRDLAQPPDRQGAFGYLTRMTVKDAALTVDDRKLGVTWEATRLDAALRRGADGFSGDLALAIDRGDHNAELHGDFQFEAPRQRLLMSVSFDNLRPSVYAAAAPALAPFAAFDLPLGGQISMTLDVDAQRVSDFWCELQLGQGRIVNDRFQGGELKIVKGTMRAVYDPASRRLELEQFETTVNAPDGPKLVFTGAIAEFDPLSSKPLDFNGHLKVRDLAVADLPAIWPEHVAIHARDWILGHLLQGRLTGSDITLAGTIQLGSPAGLVATVAKVDGNLNYRDVAIQYFPPLSPVRNIAGTAHFDRTRFDLFPKGGKARDVKVTSGTVRLTRLDTDDEEATVDLTLTGPLGTILDELNSKPLRFARSLGINPAEVKGTAAGDLHFHFPMKKGLRFEQVEYAARGKLDKVAIRKVLFDRDLTAGDMRLTVDRGALDLDGTAKLEGVPVALDWKENFAGDSVRTRYRVRGTFDDAARRRLGIDWVPDMVWGPIGVALSFARHRNDLADSDVMLDLSQANLTLPKLGWSKKPGVPATAHLTIATGNHTPTRISDFRLRGGGLDALLDLTLTDDASDAKIARVNLSHLILGRTDIAGRVTRRAEGGWTLQLRGKSFDASTLLDDMQNGAPGAAREPPLVIEADIDRVLLAPNRVLRDVHTRLFSDGLHWQAARLDAALSPGAKLSLRFGTPAGDRNFYLATDDLGGLLKLLDISSKVRGGQLSVTARVEDIGARRILRGKFDGANYRLVNAPALAQLLSLASLTGAAALVGGQGIPFSRVQADFTLDNGKIDLRNARAYGEAIGVNANGRFDYRGNTIDLSGTIVPAYLLNSLLSNIPVLGDILLGGRGQGIFAANFRVAGSMSDPGISVNPLSALAPGFLRGLFLFDAGTPATDNARSSITPNGG